MDRIQIRGGGELNGVIPISGAKNAALHAGAILALSDAALKKRLDAWRAKQTKSVAKKPK